MRINSDFIDVLREFNAAGVEFLVIGAHAVARYPRPRATGDFEFYVGSSTKNAALVFESLARFGAPMAGVSAADFATDDVVFQIGTAPVRIDILTSIDGVDFDEAFSRREQGELGGTPPCLSRAGRPHREQTRLGASAGSRGFAKTRSGRIDV